MLLITLLVFASILTAAMGAYLLLAPAGERLEVRKRLTLLGVRRIESDDIPSALKDEILSDVPLLNRILARMDAARQIDQRLAQAGVRMRTGAFVILSAVSFAIGFLITLLLHWPWILGLLLGVLFGLIPHLAVGMKRRLRQKRFMAHFPDALEMFARSLRAGHSFTGAIQLVAQEMPDPVGPEFQKVFDEQNLGLPLRQALLSLIERVDSLDVKFFVTAILIQRETGGNLAEIIDKIAHVIRERFRIQGQLKIYTAQARMTGIILACLPVGVALAIGVMNPDYLKPLWLERSGKVMVGIAVAMQILGTLAIRKIIRIKI